MRDDDDERISRLVGTGSGQGGGIPLPPVFGAILEALADGKVATFAELSKVVSTELEYKKARVFKTWLNWKTLTSDLLMQLDAEDFIRQPEAGFYRSTGNVIPGKELIYIPSRGVQGTVYTDAQRRVLDKINEVRAEAAREGVGSRDMDQHLSEIVNAVDKKRSKREYHAGSVSPLDGEHGSFRMCTECGNDFELTEDNFRTYKSRTEHYWNRKCTPCRREIETQRAAEKLRVTQVKRDMERLINGEGGSSVASVMARFGLDSRLARKYWDDLAALGKVPNRDRAWK